jgi:hypothetical protein
MNNLNILCDDGKLYTKQLNLSDSAEWYLLWMMVHYSINPATVQSMWLQADSVIFTMENLELTSVR